MLGRLFKQQSTPSLGSTAPAHAGHAGSAGSANAGHPGAAHAGHVAPGAATATANSHDDSYMREILYGLSLAAAVRPFHFAPQQFRLVVCQDGGSLRTKQVLFDSAKVALHAMQSPTHLTHAAAAQRLTNVNELNDCMFGCGLPSNETQLSTKVHVLDTGTAYNHQTAAATAAAATGASGARTTAVLVTRLFSVSDDTTATAACRLWHPTPALPIRDSVGPKVHSRFAIGLVIPVEDGQFADIVVVKWCAISHYLIVLQKIVTKKIVALYEAEGVGGGGAAAAAAGAGTGAGAGAGAVIPGHAKRVQFPLYAFQGEPNLHLQVVRLVKLVNYNANVPRLVGLASRGAGLPDARRAIVHAWVAEILNWLEFKDGNMSFLASLFAAVLSMRTGLRQAPLERANWGDALGRRRDVARLVVMTGNPIVAKKLVFLVNGLVPNAEVAVEPAAPEARSYSGSSDSDSARRSDSDSARGSHSDSDSGARHSDSDSARGSDARRARRDSTHAGILGAQAGSPVYAGVPRARPIPIRQPLTSLAGSPDSIKGWEIPSTRARPSALLRIETDTKVIPIVQQATVLPSSMAYLSSSLNSSLLLLASSYLLSKLSGSFMDRWKNLGASGSVGDTFADYKRPQLLRSPALPPEGDDFFNTYGKFALLGSAHKNLLRAQSMFDINELAVSAAPPPRAAAAAAAAATAAAPSPVRRTKTCILSSGADNAALVRQRCAAIMQAHVRVKGDTTLVVEPLAAAPLTAVRRGLLPHVAFLDEFRPEFTIQLCPVNPKLEAMVMNAMKNDLLFFQNNCGAEAVTSRLLFVSLRAREIKQIEMGVGEGDRGAYKTTVRKVFTPHNNSGNREAIARIERGFAALGELFHGEGCERREGCERGERGERGFDERLAAIVAQLTGV
jgi:hypothetical protein